MYSFLKDSVARYMYPSWDMTWGMVLVHGPDSKVQELHKTQNRRSPIDILLLNIRDYLD